MGAADIPRVRAETRDFATSIGPRLMIAAGALAFVVFLGLFVKHAWENNWVGPTGRVLAGAIVGVGLVAAGVRLLDREYRPLGQGLAGAGLASLYISAFGAHGFYALISREAAGVLMAAITVNAVLLAARLSARLLAGLAWVGGYLTPLLLSTGEDKALALFLYLGLLDLGAMVLDRRKPWPETVPLALAGTLILYVGWFARFFGPERFEVAAFGLLLFTAIFALGPARKQRGRIEVVFVLAALGLAALAQANRPEWLLILSLALAASALRLGGGLDKPLLAAPAAVALPLLVWWGMHYRPEAFGLAAAWVVLGAVLFLIPEVAGRAAPPDVVTGAVLLATGFAAVVLAGTTDRPVALSLFLLAHAGLHVLARRRWPWSEVVGVSAAGLATLAWFDRFFRADRADQALLLALPVAGAYLVVLVARGALGRLAPPDAGAHLVTAAFLWMTLRRVLHDSRPEALGLAAVVLAGLYLALGLVALRAHPADALQVRVELGLAAVFVTLAIPVQLGLNGITLGWAAEGVLVLVLGLRFHSPLARAGGYVVLGLAALRLFARHLTPAAPETFRPLLNAQFGTWLAVVAAMGAAVWLLRRSDAERTSWDALARPAMGAVALVLLFIALTTETRTAFTVRARLAVLAGDAAAAEAATLAGGLALSVLWTAFATGLLAAGLALRSRALFYSAYALFAFTALKVVFVDLATLRTVYRMLSFLALAVLLTAGAYLNLRFRARLLPREAA